MVEENQKRVSPVVLEAEQQTDKKKRVEDDENFLSTILRFFGIYQLFNLVFGSHNDSHNTIDVNNVEMSNDFSSDIIDYYPQDNSNTQNDSSYDGWFTDVSDNQEPSYTGWFGDVNETSDYNGWIDTSDSIEADYSDSGWSDSSYDSGDTDWSDSSFDSSDSSWDDSSFDDSSDWDVGGLDSDSTF